MTRRKSFHWRLLIALMLLALPVTASAHNVMTGAGPFINGLLHPFTATAQVLVLLSLGLLAGQRSPLNLKIPLTVFAPVSALALALTTAGMVKAVYPPILIGLALIAGVLVALDRPLPAFATGLIFAMAALALGLDSAVEAAKTADTIKTLLGIWVGLVLAVMDVAFYSSYLTRRPWQKVGIRVAGSWITAASLMILAFALRH